MTERVREGTWPPARDVYLAWIAAMLLAKDRLKGSCDIPAAELADGTTSYLQWINRSTAASSPPRTPLQPCPGPLFTTS